jgi:hypothetical protein
MDRRRNRFSENTKLRFGKFAFNTLDFEQISNPNLIIELRDTFFCRNTLRFVLHDTWSRASVPMKTHLINTLRKVVTVLAAKHSYPSILRQCRVLETLVENPWSNSILKKILAGKDVDNFRGTLKLPYICTRYTYEIIFHLVSLSKPHIRLQTFSTTSEAKTDKLSWSVWRCCSKPGAKI